MNLIVNPTALNNLLRSAQGSVARNLLERGERVRRSAQVLIHRRTGHTAASIVKRLVTEGNAPACLVGSNYDVMAYLEHGTTPHEIRPRHPGGVLVFNIGGQRIFVRVVHHPGTSPQLILERALAAAR